MPLPRSAINHSVPETWIQFHGKNLDLEQRDRLAKLQGLAEEEGGLEEMRTFFEKALRKNKGIGPLISKTLQEDDKDMMLLMMLRWGINNKKFIIISSKKEGDLNVKFNKLCKESLESLEEKGENLLLKNLLKNIEIKEQQWENEQGFVSKKLTAISETLCEAVTKWAPTLVSSELIEDTKTYFYFNKEIKENISEAILKKKESAIEESIENISSTIINIERRDQFGPGVAIENGVAKATFLRNKLNNFYDEAISFPELAQKIFTESGKNSGQSSSAPYVRTEKWTDFSNKEKNKSEFNR
jgi:hypothetical protein